MNGGTGFEGRGAATGRLDPLPGPELVFGLVGAIGTDMRMVAGLLETVLTEVGYTGSTIRVSSLLAEPDIRHRHNVKLDERPAQARYRSYMDAGNKVRELTGRPDALAILSIAAIRERRKGLTGKASQPASRTAYILDQLKRPEEIDSLRTVYGRRFVQISAYCPKAERARSLKKVIAASDHRRFSEDRYEGTAYSLIARDEEEEENPFGQRVRDTFFKADVVINATSVQPAEDTLRRFIYAFFGHPFITPNKEEYGMYMARAAALRSADLSRQVGAAICTNDGEVICLGCNEVPRPFHNSYWDGDSVDHRDHALGEDPNAAMKKNLLVDAFRRLQGKSWFTRTRNRTDPEELADHALFEDGFMDDAQLMDILEFGRIVHAEMSVITEAARRGSSLKNSTLFCTTFPCHICARHIIASGIRRVVYIEPYVKSHALNLYPEAIATHPDCANTKVEFKQFVGIAPETFRYVFEKGKRKTSKNKALDWDPLNSEPIVRELVHAYVVTETALTELIESMGWLNS